MQHDPSPKHASWLGAAVAIVLHAGIATAMLTVDPARFHADKPIEIDVAELPPPDVKPPTPVPPPPPQPEPRRVAVRQVRAPRETLPPEAPPPSAEPPPKPDEPPPIFGGSLSSTVSGPSSVSIPIGDTLATKPAPHPGARPSGGGTGDGVTPVADIYIRKYPEKLFMPDSADIYPPDARRMGIEGLVKFKLLIDEKGNVVKVRALNHVGHGMDEAAAQALMKAKFTPAIATDGRPVPCNWMWAYRFETQ